MGLDGVEIVLEVEKDFGVRIEDAEAERLLLVGQLHDLIVEKLLFDSAALPDRLRRLVFLHLQTLLSEQMQVRRKTVRSETRFIEDLGVN